MRVAMGWRQLFRRKAPPVKRRPVPAQSGDATVPRNGRLALAVLGSIILMAALAVINVKLILDPSISGKAFGPSIPSPPPAEHAPWTGPACSASDPKPRRVPPSMTFYSELSAREEGKAVEEAPRETPAAERAPDHSQRKATGAEDRRPEKKATEHPRVAETCPPTRELHYEELPGPDSGTGKYVVQVGAFTNPSIAWQWAQKWKSRGHEVLLKPVARPHAGVLYRLYLGQFNSAQEADALVKRLREKEGITAIRLLVRN